VCGSAIAQALKYGLDVVLNMTMVTGDGSVHLAKDAIARSRANFMLACLELNDAIEFANLVAPLGLEGVYLLDGPGLPVFMDRVPGADYLFRLSQWRVWRPAACGSGQH
jgi:hypothetical protein